MTKLVNRLVPDRWARSRDAVRGLRLRRRQQLRQAGGGEPGEPARRPHAARDGHIRRRALAGPVQRGVGEAAGLDEHGPRRAEHVEEPERQAEGAGLRHACSRARPSIRRTASPPATSSARSRRERSSARAILQPLEAPQGPTCIYRTQTGKTFISLAVQSLKFNSLKRQLDKREAVTVSDRTAYCGFYGQKMLYAPLNDGRVLSVAAPCGGREAVRGQGRAEPRLTVHSVKEPRIGRR